MSLFLEIQSMDGRQLFEFAREGIPRPDTPPEDIEALTVAHLSKIELVPPILDYVRLYGAWATKQAEAGEISMRDANMLLMGAMGTAAAFVSYALGEHHKSEG